MLWNSLAEEIRLAKSVSSFKSLSKNALDLLQSGITEGSVFITFYLFQPLLLFFNYIFGTHLSVQIETCLLVCFFVFSLYLLCQYFLVLLFYYCFILGLGTLMYVKHFKKVLYK